jgi:LPS-assembly protein
VGARLGIRIAALLVAGLVAGAVLAGTPAAAQEFPVEAGVYLTADEVTYDRESGTVTARGNVEVSRDDRTLLADEITYAQTTDVLSASGNVSLLEPTGEVLFASRVELSGDLKDGIVEDIRVILEDLARIAANGARLSADDTTEMRRAVYSPCDLCPDDPTRPPLWQIKAVKVVHDKKRKMIEYSDAWMEIAGVPVAYTPYFSHPDPTVRRRSGFLAPSVGGSSDLGLIAQVPYYYVIDEHSDLTATPIYTDKEGPLLAAEYRRMFQHGRIEVSGSITEDSEDDVRGHIFGEGRLDIDETWRAGIDVERSSDDTFLRRYGFNQQSEFQQSELTSRVFAEGFRKRNYMAINAYAFQGLREFDDPGTTPWVFPMLDYNHVGEVDRYGGRPSLDANLMALTRTGGTDTRRLSVRGGWQRPFVGAIGDLLSVEASFQGDLYHVDSLDRGGTDGEFSGVTGRFVPQVAMNWRYPLAKTSGTISQSIEPIAQVIVSPYGGNPNAIPNEDSQDFEFDETNLFSTNRFTGVDRVESGPRVNYGLRWGVFGNKGGSTTILVGQSYRLKSDDTFADQSGLDDDLSDIVARAHVSPRGHLDVYYRTRLDKDDLSARRNEVKLSAGPPALRLNADYVFFERQADSEFPAREELTTSVSAQFSRYWRGQVSAKSDLADSEMRSAGLGLTYEDECLVFSTNLTRTFFEDRDLKPTDAILFSVTFKTLGEVATKVQ